MTLVFLAQLSEATSECCVLMVFATEWCNLRWSYATCSSQVLGELNDALGVFLSTLNREEPRNSLLDSRHPVSAFHTEFLTPRILF